MALAELQIDTATGVATIRVNRPEVLNAIDVPTAQAIRDAVLPALDSAGLEPKDIDGIFLGHFNAGFVGQDFTASLPAVAMPEFRHTPAVRTENACATGSAAIWAALDAMAARRMMRTLVIGMEKMNELTTPQVAATLIKCSYVKEEGADPTGFAGIFGGIATQYFERFGEQSDALAAISVDSPVPADVCKALLDLPDVLSATTVNFR